MKLVRTFEIREKDPENIKIITDFLMSYRHAENMILILISDLFKDFQTKSDEEKETARRISSHLLNFMVMKSVLSKNRGKKLASSVAELNSYYENNHVFQNLVALCYQKLNSHNMSMILRRLKSNFSNIFKAIKKNSKVSFPKAKKLRFLNKMSLPLEAGKFSVYKKKISLHKKKTTLGLTLGKKQILVFLGECDYIKNKVITSATVGYSNGEISYFLSYEKTGDPTRTGSESPKTDDIKSWAGIDLGVYNLLSVGSLDPTVKSLIFADRTPFRKNSSYNKVIADLSSSIAMEEAQPLPSQDKIKRLRYARGHAHERRKRYFNDYNQSLSCLVLEHLSNHGVKNLVISKNLNRMKTKGAFKSKDKKLKQKFYQIPRGKLIDLIQEKSYLYGIKVKEVNEAFTSLTSCLTGDVQKVQSSKNLQADPMCSRGKKGDKALGRGLYRDGNIKKIFNSDLNGAFNHIKLVLGGSSSVTDCISYEKLCNPKKIKSKGEFSSILRSRLEIAPQMNAACGFLPHAADAA